MKRRTAGLRLREETAALVLLSILPLCRAHAAVDPADVPTFDIRARVVSIAGKAPTVQQFSFLIDPAAGSPARVTHGADWCDWMEFGIDQASAAVGAYPNSFLGHYPVSLHLIVSGVVDPTTVEVQIDPHDTHKLVYFRCDLFGPRLGILVSKGNDGIGQFNTMATYNRRYWKAFPAAQASKPFQIHNFPIADRFIGGDDDHQDWEEGITHLAQAGLSAIELAPSPILRQMLLTTGLRRTTWAVYNPPGDTFDYDPTVTQASIDAWAKGLADSYAKAGYSPQDMASFAMSDEPGWYYPTTFHELEQSPAGMARFHLYLQQHGLRPADVGVGTWDEALPVGRSRAKDLPSRRLFYWTMRFFTWDSERHFSRCARALESAFYPGLPVFTNWNFFNGRFYIPGPVGKNPSPKDPDSAIGLHDWMEFGRLRGGTTLWAEDWFQDAQAYQWSYYAARLRSAAQKSGVEFGGYIVPAVSGDRQDGLMQKMLSLIGSGAKAMDLYVFGPEYNFPGNCYSENLPALGKIAEANRMIAGAEDLLWPGRRPSSPVAILAPRSAEIWDDSSGPSLVAIPATGHATMNGAREDYLAEVADLYLALQHANIPVEFVDEDDLNASGLKPYKVLYVTEPDVPVEGQAGIAQWVNAGGTLVTVAGATSGDRYGDPLPYLSKLQGYSEKPLGRILNPAPGALKLANKVNGMFGEVNTAGNRGAVVNIQGQILARFGDGQPAVTQRNVGAGHTIHFAWVPGLSYAHSSTGLRDRLPIGFSTAVRNWITFPVELAKIVPPVTAGSPMVETPVLLSAQGAAVTLLNWTGAPLPHLSLTIRVPFKVRQVASVLHGVIPFRQLAGGIRLNVPLKSADILMLRP